MSAITTTAPARRRAEQAVDFLLDFSRGEPVLMVFIDPRPNEPSSVMKGSSWVSAEQREQAVNRVAVAEQAGHNCYWTVNAVRPDFRGTKPAKADITQIRGVYADLDPDDRLPRDEARKTLENRVAALPGELDPFAVIDSGNGLQPVWRLPKSIPTADAQAQAEQVGERLAEWLQGDKIQNIDRILRVPFTKNFPDAKKVKKGRKVCVAGVYRNGGTNTLLETLDKALPPIPASNTMPLSSAKTPHQRLLRATTKEALAQLPATLRADMAAIGADLQLYAHLAALWEGRLDHPDLTRFAHDRSAAVMSLLVRLAKNRPELRDPSRLRDLAEQSPLVAMYDADGKWTRLADGECRRAIAKALEIEQDAIAARQFDVIEPDQADPTQPAAEPAVRGRTHLNDFYAYLPQHRYIYIPTGELWVGDAVNSAVPWPAVAGKPQKPADFLDRQRPIHQMTWIPGETQVIADRLVADGGWVAKAGARTFNLYRPPHRPAGDPSQAGRWQEHLRRIYPDEADHIERWLAHRLQQPGDKVNHALVLGGGQGIGKDTLLEPVKVGVGSHNWAEISPAQMLGRFNGWAKSVVLRISEARDLGDVDRFKFYDHSKTFIAAPPDVLRVDEKNLREHAVPNVTGVIITTNHLTDGIYLPPDDRRHYVAWSTRTKDDFDQAYWNGLWAWYAQGGLGHVIAYLLALDLTGWNQKAPPPRTSAWEAIVAANHAPEDAEMADLLDVVGRPVVVTTDELRQAAKLHQMYELGDLIADRRQRRAMPHRMERVGYSGLRNPNAKDGQFKVNGRRVTVYGRQDASVAEQHRAIAAKQQPANPVSGAATTAGGTP